MLGEKVDSVGGVGDVMGNVDGDVGGETRFDAVDTWPRRALPCVGESMTGQSWMGGSEG